MKRKSPFFYLLLFCLLMSCKHHRGNISIEYSESDHYYSMDAWFHEYQTREVEEYMDDKIGKQSNTSFADTRIDGRIGLDDHTNFYINKSPGHIKIELDKRRNSVDSYRKIKSMCEGIKMVLQ